MTPDEELAEIKACVEGALGWLAGYTDPFPDGEQRRVTQQDDGTWLFGPVPHPGFSQARERRVRVTVVVEEVEDVVDVEAQPAPFSLEQSPDYVRLTPPATSSSPRLLKARRALEAIRIRCREGDKSSDWLPTIDQLATEALEALEGLS